MKRFRGYLRCDEGGKDTKKNNTGNDIAQIHRHRHGIASGLAKRRRKNFNYPKSQSDRRHLAQIVSEDPELSFGDPDATDKHLSGYIRSFPYFREAMLTDAHGAVIASSSPSEVGTSLFAQFDDTRDEFEETLHRLPGVVYISDLSEIPDSLRRPIAAGKFAHSNFGIQLLTAVQNEAGHTVGVLVADVLTESLRDLLEDLKRHAPIGSSACLLDKGGLVLMTTSPQATLLSPHPDVTGGALRASLGKNSSGYLVYRDSGGVRRMAACTRLGTYGSNQVG